MACPSFEHFMRPVLELLADGRVVHWRELVAPAADKLDLSSEDRVEMIASGKEPKLVNRVYWARTYLKQAGLVMTPSRGKVTITDSGKSVLTNPPSIVDVKYLMSFQAFREFRSRTRDKQDEVSAVEEPQDQTPEEMLESGIELIHSKVASELLEIIQVMPPRDFEELVVDLMVALGYGGSFKDAAKAIGGSGDEGVDGIIKEDKLGLDVIYVQAKRHGSDNPVGDDHIRNFIGSLVTKSAKKGVFVTTSSFRPKAKDMIKGIDQRIVLIDGFQLTTLMIEHGIGVSTVATYSVPKVDSDYFSFLSEEG